MGEPQNESWKVQALVESIHLHQIVDEHLRTSNSPRELDRLFFRHVCDDRTEMKAVSRFEIQVFDDYNIVTLSFDFDG